MLDQSLDDWALEQIERHALTPQERLIAQVLWSVRDYEFYGP